jgi:DNA-binding transcriptional LysR family regulator
MFDFRLKVFYTAAKRLSFSRASEELFISQPAVSKHISTLEKAFKVKLFVRQGSKISLTPEGKLLFAYAEEIFALYRKLQFEMDQRAAKNNGKLSLGASTTIAQYVIPGILAKFHHQFPDIQVNLINGNTQQIETALLQKDIELGVIEGYAKKTDLKYTPFMKDEIVLVSRKDHPLAKAGEIDLNTLKKIPLAIREFGSGTLQVIQHYLKSQHLSIADLNIEIQLGSTEGIKTYLRQTHCFAFLSLNSVLEELNRNELSIIEIPGPGMSRFFHFIIPHGSEEPLADMFMNFVFRNFPLKQKK